MHNTNSMRLMQKAKNQRQNKLNTVDPCCIYRDRHYNLYKRTGSTLNLCDIRIKYAYNIYTKNMRIIYTEILSKKRDAFASPYPTTARKYIICIPRQFVPSPPAVAFFSYTSSIGKKNDSRMKRRKYSSELWNKHPFFYYSWMITSSSENPMN